MSSGQRGCKFKKLSKVSRRINIFPHGRSSLASIVKVEFGDVAVIYNMLIYVYQSEKHPIILPKEYHLTTLIVLKAHDKVYHNGTKETLTEVT